MHLWSLKRDNLFDHTLFFQWVSVKYILKSIVLNDLNLAPHRKKDMVYDTEIIWFLWGSRGIMPSNVSWCFRAKKDAWSSKFEKTWVKQN